jgi:hypothetical protein
VRILFDTNVLFAAFTTRGFCEELVDETIDLCTIIWSPPLRAELISALRRKRLVTPICFSFLGPGFQIWFQIL